VAPEVKSYTKRPIHYVCPSCRLYLLAWDPPTRFVEIHHKVGLWADFWSGDVRLVCQHCLGATDVLPVNLVMLLRDRFGLPVPWDPARDRLAAALHGPEGAQLSRG
jgi:hypothetical protein